MDNKTINQGGQKMKFIKRNKVENGDVLGCGCVLIPTIIVIIVIPLLIFFSRNHYFIFLSEKDKDTIHRMFNITIDDSVTPVKMKLIGGPGGHRYELWLKDIDDPEKFMENCYDGSYAVIEDKNSLIEFGEKSISALYDYNGSLVADSSYIMYTREYDDGYKPDRYSFVIAFYKDGDSFKAKVVDDYWT
jgi:hypothetical protein